MYTYTYNMRTRTLAVILIRNLEFDNIFLKIVVYIFFIDRSRYVKNQR